MAHFGISTGQSSQTKPKPTKQLRLLLVPVALLLTAFICGGALYLRRPASHGFRVPGHHRDASHMYSESLDHSGWNHIPMVSLGRMNGFYQGTMNFPFNRSPRFFANLSVQSGEYLISIRQIMGDSFRQSLVRSMETSREDLQRPMSHLTISLQVMASKPESIQRIKTFAEDLAVSDSSGRPLAVNERSETLPLGKQSGLIRLFRLTSKAPLNGTLSELTGQLVIDSPKSGSVKHVPFHFKNIPLPNSPILYVETACASLTPEQLTKLGITPPANSNPHWKNELTKQQQQTLRQFTQNKSASNFGQPDRIVIQADSSCPLTLTFPKIETGKPLSPILGSIIAHPGELGEADVSLLLKLAGKNSTHVTAKQTLWDDSPALLMLRSPNTNQILAIMLTMQREHWDFQSQPIQPKATPYPIQGAIRGGVIQGSLLMPGRVLGLGLARIQIAPLSGGEPRVMELILDENGRFLLSNLPPGRYRITLLDARPVRASLRLPFDWQRYGRKRYQVPDAAWQPPVQEVEVRAGGYSLLSGWRLTGTGGLPEVQQKTKNPSSS